MVSAGSLGEKPPKQASIPVASGTLGEAIILGTAVDMMPLLCYVYELLSGQNAR